MTEMRSNLRLHYSTNQTDTDPTTVAWNAMQFEVGKPLLSMQLMIIQYFVHVIDQC